METVRQRVNRIVADQFQVDAERLTDAASIHVDLCATSLDRIEVVMTLEDDFGIAISDEEVVELRTVGDLVACVTAHLRGAPPADSEGSRPSVPI
jgi:acyl carrier protein